MQFSSVAIIASLMGSVGAFTPSAKQSRSSTTLSALNVDEFKSYYTKSAYENVQLENLPADQGFDPFQFSDTYGKLDMREAEIKHARLAMLAAAGWPLAELLDRPLANLLNKEVIVDAADRSPSILNGGLGKISPFYWATILAAASLIDIYQINKANQDPNYKRGDLGFDPFGLYPKDKEGRTRMQTAEIKNGRLAMIAITAFAAQEFVSKLGVVDETPVFFHPFGF